MSAKKITIDALTRALCPSIDATLLANAISLSSHSPGRVRISGHGLDSGLSQTYCASQARTLHTNSPARGKFAQKQLYPQWSAPAAPKAPKRVAGKRAARGPRRPKDRFPTWAAEGTSMTQLPEPEKDAQQSDSVNGAKGQESDLPSELGDVATPAIYEMLRRREGHANASEIQRLVRYLVEERSERPNVVMYEALAAANWNPTTGSAATLAAMVKEMMTFNIGSSPAFFHSALRVLAIHPDYLHRKTVLQRMSEAGIDLKDDGKHSVALALLREGQNEMALDYWNQMLKEGTQIPLWMSLTFLYVLVGRGFLNEAIRLFHQVLKRAEDKLEAAPLVVWHYLLDECSKGMHYDGTSFIWKQMVEPGTINPSDGIALNVLNTAARHGDAALATAAIEILSGRQVKLHLHHYEPLLESYAKAGDLEKAFGVLCVMKNVWIQPNESSTRSLYLMLKDAPELADEAVRALGNLSKEHDLPVVAINVLLEAVSKTQPMARTLDIYRSVCELCKSGPNQQTFVLLLNECTTAKDAVVLVSEMDRWSIQPSPAILDQLIRCFVKDGSLDVALLYLDELSRFPVSSPWVSTRTLLAVLFRCYEDNDTRALKVMREAKRRGVELEPGVLARLNQLDTAAMASSS